MDFRLTLVFLTALYCSTTTGMFCLALHFGSTKYIDYTSECVTIMIVAGAHTMTIDCIENVIASKLCLIFPSTQLLLYTSTLPVATQSLHLIYILFRDHEEGMIEMECQVEMAEMEHKERGEILVCRGHLAHEVCMLTMYH